MKPRLLSGIQPTGKLHIGNFLGAVSNWVKLQSSTESFVMIADLHSLTTVYDNPTHLQNARFELILDLLASGINPDQSCMFIQSRIPAHAQLHLIFSMITPLPWLTRVPTYKGKVLELKDKDLDTYGFLGYPVLQAADIALYKGQKVPIGKDQMPHLELTREIIRRFNHFYNTTLPEPEDVLTQTPVLLGTDGRKMSKSYANTIPISAPESEINTAVMSMITDPDRKRRHDPGNPDICPVFSYHRAFNSKERVDEINQDCRSAAIGCVQCKQECAKTLIAYLEPVRSRYDYWKSRPQDVENIIQTGSNKANTIASETLHDIQTAIGL